ncbi:40S ribosomal protein S5-like [Acipenser oxyrinchus oxyrinchus]|uniref:Small ribosomal subunit protein uS7 n=1 Tax=Acipenser oxyrinchus oxyrinchus TaxID=40147 RepID=A0AAD8CIA9_ACIOX|nr:40S ribosomal protein S5-like [Acipenser oxyrinchus oxyrinchus]
MSCSFAASQGDKDGAYFGFTLTSAHAHYPFLPPDVSYTPAYETVNPRQRPSFLADIVETDSAHKMTEWENAPAAVAESPEIKLFGKWSTDDVQINDISLQDYIACKEKYAKYLPHSGGRYAAKRFRKAQCPIVERLTNSMMMHGRNNGKKLLTCRIVKHAFEIIHLLTGENPLQVLVNAIINSGPREDSTRIGRAGTVRRQAVDVSPLRRVNQAIWLLCTGAREAAFRNIKTIAECLADELINAAKGSSNSYAIKKKDELERVAKSNR